ncbi:MAG: hypothetical protein JWQ24_4780 [Tardiphaga sp.]|nr:hypothetical protein [Tardiphaga sp.]
MVQPRDNWEKPRSKGQHLTADEIAFIKSEYRKRSSIRDVARSLKCSSRVVSKYFGLFKAEGVRGVPFNPASQQPSRFYKSNFEV